MSLSTKGANPKETSQHNEADVPDAWWTTWGGTGRVWGARMVKIMHWTWICHTCLLNVDSTGTNWLGWHWSQRQFPWHACHGNCHLPCHKSVWYLKLACDGPCTTRLSFFFFTASFTEVPVTPTSDHHMLDCIDHVINHIVTGACSCVWNSTNVYTLMHVEHLTILHRCTASLLDDPGELSLVISGVGWCHMLTLHSVNSFRVDTSAGCPTLDGSWMLPRFQGEIFHVLMLWGWHADSLHFANLFRVAIATCHLALDCSSMLPRLTWWWVLFNVLLPSVALYWPFPITTAQVCNTCHLMATISDATPTVALMHKIEHCTDFRLL